MKLNVVAVRRVSVLIALLPGVAQALTVTVVNTSDSGAGSLRQAITDVNGSVDASNTIDFNIPGAPPHTITPATYLPQVDKKTLVDGFSQPGYSNGVPAIVLDGSSVGGGWSGLRVTAAECTVRGLEIRDWSSEGIHLYSDASNCVVVGCHLLDNGVAASGSGVFLYEVGGCTIGGTTVAERNVATGNGYAGIRIYGASANNNTVLGNYLGVDSTGLVQASNKYYGVYIGFGSGNTVGGTAAGARNVISGNGSAGVAIGGSSASNNAVVGNYIGTDATGGAAIGNREYGINVNGASRTTIGGMVAGAGNVVAGCGYYAVYITGGDAFGCVVAGNYIGTDATGMIPLTNDSYGVRIWQAPSNTIGGSSAGARNVICACGNSGVSIGGNTTAGNVVQGNYVGVAADGVTPLPNCWSGISAGGITTYSPECTIGGTNAGEGNVVSGNAWHGVLITGTNAFGNFVQGNMIGLGADGSAVGNGRHGVHVYSASSNTIGGVNEGGGNFIAYNSYSGVCIEHSNSMANAILGNSIYENGELGIDLGDDNTVEPNDWQDADTGPNGLQNWPYLSSATFGSTTVYGQLASKPNSQYRLEFFASPTANASGNGEGRSFLGGTNILTGPSGEYNFSITLPISVAKYHYVTATATDEDNNTSEFSDAVQITFTDFDFDRIEAQWEDDHGLSDTITNDGVDTDGDGFLDLWEFWADTHPNDSNDYPRITAISNGASPVVYFPSSSARLYRMKVVSALNGSNTWNYIAPQLSGNGGTMSLDAPPGADRAFCRIEVELP